MSMKAQKFTSKKLIIQEEGKLEAKYSPNRNSSKIAKSLVFDSNLDEIMKIENSINLDSLPGEL